MALVLADRVLETTTTTGSGTITLAGAEPGYQSFSVIGNANQTYYTLTTDSDWEVGIGTYTASGTTLSRDTVLASSNSGNRITLPAGSKKVFVTYPAEKSVNFDVSGNITALSGVITNVGYPSDASDAATKLYVDTLAAQGITYHTPVKYEVPNSTGNLTATYNNGTAGVSATLTNAGTLAAFVPDGVTATISDRVLIYNQTNGFENGVYTVTTVGNGSTAWVLTRATDADTYALKSPNGLGGGDAFYVTSGNTGAGETYLCNNSGVITFGSTAISFVQISAAQVYSAGNGLSLTNTVFSLATPVAVANGGTGTSATPTNGQLLIGNGSGYTLATLTAGSGVSITNSAGSITLTATGSGGTVVDVTASAPLASTGGTSPNISIANSTGTGSVVLDQGATISSATITAGVSASITTITGTSANITTVSGTTARFSSAAITQLSGTSAGITTVTGTTTSFASGTITQFGATSATIGTVSGTNLTYTNGNMTSATVTNLGSTSANVTTLTSASATITNLLATTLTVSGNTFLATSSGNVGIGLTNPAFFLGGGLQVSRAGIATVRISNRTDSNSFELIVDSTTNGVRFWGANSAPFTFEPSGTERMRLTTAGQLGIGKIPTTTLDVSGTITGTNGAFTSANITTLTGTTATYTSATVTNLNVTSVTLSNLSIASANITTLTGTTFGTTATTQLRGASAQITNISATSITVTNTPAFVGNGTLTMNVSGTGLSGSQTFTANQAGNATFTVTSNATNANTGSTIVARDASGNFSAGTITATLNGNASTATSATSASNSTTTSQRAFSGDISTTGQGRFTGWYSGGAATGLATEVGVSGGQGYIIVYNRDTSTYGTLNVGTGSATMQFSGSTINVTSGALQQGGSQVLTASNVTTYMDAPNKAGTSYYQANTWIQFNGSYGLYAPAVNNAHWYPNTASTYAPWIMVGSRNGYSGVSMSYGNNVVLMQGGGNGSGLYNESYGWQIYWSSGTLYVYKSAYGGGTAAVAVDSSNVYDYAGVVQSEGTITSPLTLNTAHVGGFITVGSGGSITVPNSTFSAGQCVSIYNDTTGGISINISLSTCYISGTNTNRTGVTLATRGLATILFVTSTQGVISGNVT